MLPVVAGINSPIIRHALELGSESLMVHLDGQLLENIILV